MLSGSSARRFARGRNDKVLLCAHKKSPLLPQKTRQKWGTHPPKTYGVPFPINPAVCGLPPLLSLTPTCAVRDPVVVGVNVTWTTQWAPAARVLPQLVISAKSPGLGPASVMLEMLTVVVPLLIREIFRGELVVPTV